MSVDKMTLITLMVIAVSAAIFFISVISLMWIEVLGEHCEPGWVWVDTEHLRGCVAYEDWKNK